MFLPVTLEGTHLNTLSSLLTVVVSWLGHRGLHFLFLRSVSVSAWFLFSALCFQNREAEENKTFSSSCSFPVFVWWRQIVSGEIKNGECCRRFVTFLAVRLFSPRSAFLLLPPLRPLLRVHALVPPQVAEGAAGVAALVAAVRLLAGVGAGVALQVDELRRGVRADGAAVGLLAVVGPHVALQVVGVAGGEGAQRAGEEFRGEVSRRTSFSHASPLPVGAIADGSISRVRGLHLGGVAGGFVLEAFLAGQTIKLRPQVQANTCTLHEKGEEP